MEASNSQLVSIKSVMSAAGHKSQPLALEIDGVVRHIEFRPVSINEVLMIARKHRGILEVLHSALHSDGSTKSYSDKTLYDVIVDAGPEACAAFVSYASGLGDDIQWQKEFMSAPDDFVWPVIAHVIDITLGDRSVEDYFLHLLVHFVKVRAFKGLEQKAAKTSPRKPTPKAANKVAKVIKTAA
ncbi:hypothetical protein ACCS79_03565 [Rhizobium johnstonii]|uniref:hypothetical protein n=1 Tax=Rhizobium johnstonii TaxID=3019933 RepID=UPI003F9A19F7